MDSGDDTPWALLTRHLSGVASPEEEAALHDWIAADASRAEFVRAIRAAWELTAHRPSRHDAAAGWERVQRRLHTTAQVSDGDRGRSVFKLHTSPPVSPVRRWGVRAAGLAAAAFVGAMVMRTVVATRTDPATTAAAALPMREYATVAGQRADIRLPDGSRVVLAPETILRVPVDIGDSVGPSGRSTPREVTLSGTAFFDVTHDDRRPFLVRTRGGVARDIGTEFEVRADDRAASMQVTVVSGIVAVHETRLARSPGATAAPAGLDSTPVAVLHQGDRITLADNRAPVLAHGVDVEPTLAWLTGRLVFKGTPLREVALELSRWYDVDVRLADSVLADRPLVLTLNDESASAAIDAIALALNLRVERRERHVTLHSMDNRSR